MPMLPLTDLLNPAGQGAPTPQPPPAPTTGQKRRSDQADLIEHARRPAPRQAMGHSMAASPGPPVMSADSVRNLVRHLPDDKRVSVHAILNVVQNQLNFSPADLSALLLDIRTLSAPRLDALQQVVSREVAGHANARFVTLLCSTVSKSAFASELLSHPEGSNMAPDLALNDILRLFHALPAPLHSVAVKLLRPQPKAEGNPARVLDVLLHVPREHRSKAVQQFSALLGSGKVMPSMDTLDLFCALSEDQKQPLLTALGRVVEHNAAPTVRAGFVHALAIFPPDAVGPFVEQVLAATDGCAQGMHLLRAMEALAKVSPNERNAMVRIIRSLCTPAVKGNNRAQIIKMLCLHAAPVSTGIARAAASFATGTPPNVLEKIVSSLALSSWAEGAENAVRLALPLVHGMRPGPASSILRLIAWAPVADQPVIAGALSQAPIAAQDAIAVGDQVARMHGMGVNTRQLFEQCLPTLRRVRNNPDLVADILIDMAQTPPSQREAALAQLTFPALRIDQENVMRGSRIGNARASLRAFVAQTPQPEAPAVSIYEALSYFRGYLSDAPAQTPQQKAMPQWGRATAAERDFARSVRTSDGATELQNFERTLTGAPRAGDYTPALVDNPTFQMGDDHEPVGLANAAARAWAFIKTYEGRAQDTESVAKAKANMMWGWFKAHVECIETDDSHRVCDVGYVQRLMKCVQNRFEGSVVEDRPIVEDIVNHAIKLHFMQLVDKDKDVWKIKEAFKLAEPSDVQKKAYVADGMAMGRRHYVDANPTSLQKMSEEDSAERMQKLETQLNTFLELTYPPDEAEPATPNPQA